MQYLVTIKQNKNDLILRTASIRKAQNGRVENDREIRLLSNPSPILCTQV